LVVIEEGPINFCKENTAYQVGYIHGDFGATIGEGREGRREVG
jgi:hypothetical protein